jgi:peptidoglycan/LPS O-acetylase OafA/YrhL
MKVDPVPSFIAITISGLIAYGFYAFWGGGQLSNLRYATTGFSLLFSLVTLICAIGINFETSRITTVIRALSGVSFFVGLGVLMFITKLTDSLPTLIIVMGILSLLFVLIAYTVSKSGQ